MLSAISMESLKSMMKSLIQFFMLLPIISDVPAPRTLSQPLSASKFLLSQLRYFCWLLFYLLSSVDVIVLSDLMLQERGGKEKNGKFILKLLKEILCMSEDFNTVS